MTSAEVEPFVEWGGRTWALQVRRGLAWLGDVTGLRVLEIGTRYGGMATLLALKGANVTALDVNADTFEAARATSRHYGVGDRVLYDVYSGDPADLPGGFDVVFSKSTLVLMPDLAAAFARIAESLVDGGRFLAVENARGALPIHVARMIRRGSFHPHGANYLTQHSVESLRRVLDVKLQHWTSMPPTVLLGATKSRSEE